MSVPTYPAMAMTIHEIRERFGLLERRHRIGSLDLRVAEVGDPDAMVREVYPEAVTDHGDAPVWMITWPAALALAEHLVLNEDLRGRPLLELGCGTAAPGIAAERAGARVLCTDYDPIAMEVARYNAGLNECANLEIRPLDWVCPDLNGSFDVVVGSEIVYFEKTFSPLLSVLKSACSPGGRVILSDPGRPQMDAFLEMCEGAGFRIQQTRRAVHLPTESRTIRIVTLAHRLNR